MPPCPVQNEFQKKFWKLRQAEWEPYTLLHSPLRITQGEGYTLMLWMHPFVVDALVSTARGTCTWHQLGCARTTDLPVLAQTCGSNPLQAMSPTPCTLTSLCSPKRPRRAPPCEKACRSVHPLLHSCPGCCPGWLLVVVWQCFLRSSGSPHFR